MVNEKAILLNLHNKYSSFARLNLALYKNFADSDLQIIQTTTTCGQDEAWVHLQ